MNRNKPPKGHQDKTLHGHGITVLNAQDSKAFLDAIAKPVQFNDALTAALEAHDREVSSK